MGEETAKLIFVGFEKREDEPLVVEVGGVHSLPSLLTRLYRRRPRAASPYTAQGSRRSGACDEIRGPVLPKYSVGFLCLTESPETRCVSDVRDALCDFPNPTAERSMRLWIDDATSRAPGGTSAYWERARIYFAPSTVVMPWRTGDDQAGYFLAAAMLVRIDFDDAARLMSCYFFSGRSRKSEPSR